ncbi:MAG: hypothetical protein IJ738_05865, partial [Alphaproteobacteria bacterium]|nr:hypothetical protein [Alphaproteobacteria bacterium]
KKALPSVKEMILSCVREDEKLLQKVEKAFVFGRRTQRAKISPLTNPAIIDAAYYRWRNMSVLPGKKVIYKLLSERIK